MHRLLVKRLIPFLLGLTISFVTNAEPADSLKKNFPRICNVNFGAPQLYDKPDVIAKLARADMALIGFYRNWESDHNRGSGVMRRTVQNIKALNQDILIGQYTVLNASPDTRKKTPDIDKSQKIEAMDWWVRGAMGEKLQWTNQYGKFDVNFTKYAPVDSEGKRYPEWLAERDYDYFFSNVPEFDIWYLDNVFPQPKIKLANWTRGNGLSLQTAASVQQVYRAGHLAEWKAIRALNPDILLLGNVDQDAYATPEYSGQLNGALLEALMGLRWSTEHKKGWFTMMERYHNAFAHLREPKLVVFNVHGKLQDYQAMRFGLSSALMNDGFFSYSELGGSYRSIPWFDEYDIDLGKPIEAPQRKPWRNGVYRREFEKGVVFVNPSAEDVLLDNEEKLFRFSGKQAPDINNGEYVGDRFNLPARDGVIFLKVN